MATANKNTTNRKKAARRYLKRTVIVLVVVGFAAAVVVAALPKPVPVESAIAERGELVVTIDEDGRARVKDRYIVSAPLGGNLARIELRPGDEVKQGEILARIVPLRAPLLDERSRTEIQARVAASLAATRQTEAQIERARATLSFAEKETQRARQLARGGAISEQELERALLEERARRAELTSAQFGSKVATHELAMARAALGQLKSKDGDAHNQFEVPSPTAGRVLKVIQESEGAVQPGAPLLEIGDPKALEIVVDVLTKDAVSIQPGSPVTIEEWGGPPLDAVVRLVEPSAFTRLSALGVEEQRVNTIIDLKQPYEEWNELGDGYRVEARIEIFRSEGTVNVPASALFRREGKWAAFLVQDGHASLRTVEIGRRSDRAVEITSGIQPGETIILHPSDQVTGGVEVTTE